MTYKELEDYIDSIDIIIGEEESAFLYIFLTYLSKREKFDWKEMILNLDLCDLGAKYPQIGEYLILDEYAADDYVDHYKEEQKDEISHSLSSAGLSYLENYIDYTDLFSETSLCDIFEEVEEINVHELLCTFYVIKL